MKLLFIGDIVARPGRAITAKILPILRKEYGFDYVIANVENAAHGSGITQKTYDELSSTSIDFMTSGNHIWANPEGIDLLTKDTKIIRPANYPEGTPGCGWKIVEVSKKKLLVINLIGRVFMRDHVDCPFRTFDSILSSVKDADIYGVVVDFHAETTSEKVAFGRYVEGRASAVFGTHTHIPTADETILPGGTAYISDVGMTGLKDSVLGVKKEVIIKKYLTQIHSRHEYEDQGITLLRAVAVELDPVTGKALSIERIVRELDI